jgi:hypothetical protein
MPEDSEDSIAEALARLERDVANLKNALVQLGAKPCSVCAKFYRDANGNLFTACGDSVCYTCLPGWWVNCSCNLSTSDRESIEYKLTSWLIAHHRGKIFRELKELPPKEAQDVHLVVACHECRGTGTIDGVRCRHCHGNGTVWVITPKPGFSFGG